MLQLQLYSAIGAIILAWLNRIPCIKMINFGASIKEEKEWHLINAITKSFLALALTFYHTDSNGIISIVVRFFLSILVQWAFFDISLSKLLHGRFFYLGKTSAIDRRFRTIFGVQEGLWKFLICCIIIVLINLYL